MIEFEVFSVGVLNFTLLFKALFHIQTHPHKAVKTLVKIIDAKKVKISKKTIRNGNN